ncbi:lipoprotein YmcC precursor [Enterovibrio norvegicus FF-162]|uniref:YjbF family lipoprotein n=1 Tax=Enterovibrio norvegicus TaxID=188144 RepID=UPI0002D831AB|nr:YjbF family lipoprotein [Enterovibrio norvegicus]OEE74713.1 lipoprotein YmcC precursor [Enterovibrio norvegicus FF-162]
MKNKLISLKAAALIGAVSLLSGCSQKFEDVQDTMSLALFGHDDVVLSPEKIEDLPYASLYAKTDTSGQSFMVLGYASPSVSNLPRPEQSVQLKWLSANNEMLVTEFGRIVKTVNLIGGNLTASYSLDADPLALGLLNNATPYAWRRKVDFQPGYHSGYTLESRFELQGENTLMVNEKPVSTLHFIEYVHAPELNQRFENEYWLHPVSGDVIASKQTPAPGMASIELTILKPFAGVKR